MQKQAQEGPHDGSSGRARVSACGLFRQLGNSDLRSKTAPRSSGQKGSMRLVATASGLRESAGACARLPIPDELTLAPLWTGFSLIPAQGGPGEDAQGWEDETKVGM